MVQALELLNGEDFYHLVYNGKVLDQAAQKEDFAEAVDRFYWIAFSRPATPKEQKLGVPF